MTRIPDRWEGYIPTMTVSGNFAITRTNLAKDSADLKAEIGRMLAGIEEKKKAGEDIGAFTGFDAELAPHEMVPGGSAVVGALNAMGIRARFYRQTKGSTINGFVDQNNTVWINVAARSPLMAVAFHEATHVMESTEPQLYEEFVREMRAFISQKDLNVRAERYKSLGDPIKETVADFAGEMATRESFWKHLANRSPKVFARLASSVLKFFGDLIAALKKNTLPMAEVQAAKADALAKTVARHIAKYAEIRQAKREAAEEQARQEEAEKADERMARAVEALPEAGINLQEAEPVPAPQEVVRTKPKSKQAEDEPRGLNELIPEVTGIDLQNEDYRGPRLSLEDERPQRENLRLDINRAERVVAQGTLSDEEVKTLRAAAARHGLNEQEVLDKARQLKGRFPESEGWAPLTITGVEDVRRTGEKVKYNIAVQSIPYSFNVPPGGAPRRGHDQAWLNSVAHKIIGEVAGIYDRAQRGDRNAQTIMRHANWYNNVAELLRRVMGGAADVFADLLGAMSPQTTVEQNFRYAEHAIQRLSRGDFDAQLRRLQQWLDNGNKLTDFPEHDKIRQASGALFGIGSDAGALAMLNAWRQIEAGQTPKARNFVLNLLKLSNLATIDLWAARFVQRMANALSGEHPRIPPVAERGVSGKWTVSRRESDITGQYGFAAEALRIASEQLTAQGIRLSPPELQAVVWFAEKELWGSRGWTTRAGEGGSFEEELNRRDWDRYVVGVSAQSDMRPSDAVVARAQASLLAPLVGDDNVVAFRAMPTVGAFGGDVERSFDMELTTERAFDPFNLISAVARVAKNRKQKTVFISRVLRPHEKSDNARPGLEVYFRTGVSLEAATQVADQLRGLQVDGFTFVVDQRESLRTAPGGDPQQFIGLRVQYVPEYDAMWNEEARRVLGSGDEKAIRNWMEDRAAVMQEAVLEISENESVAYANVVRYDTLVLFQGDYDGYVGRRAEERHRASGEKVWPRKTLRENVEAAISRHTGEQGQDAVRDVDGVGAGLSGEGAPRLSLAGSTEPAVRPGAKADGGDGVSVTGVHFSTQEKLAALSGSRFGQGLSGRERERVYRASDPRIKRRIYFYVAQKGAEFNVKRREAGLGPYAYSAELTNLYDPSVHPEVKYERAYINREFGILDADENLNRMESAILDAGYDGYVVHRPDIAVVMNKDVPVKYLGRLGQEPKINFRFSIDEEIDYSDIPLPVSDDETLSEKINRDLEEVRAKRGMTDDDYREIGREWLKIAQDKKRFSYKFSDQDDLANVAFDMSGTKVRVKTGPASSSDIQYYSADGFRPYKTHVLTVKNKWKARVYEAKDGRVALNVADFKQGESEGSLVYQIVGTWAANSGKTFIGDPAGLSNRALVRRAVNMFSNALRTRTTKHLEPHEFQRQAGLKWRKGDDAFNIGQLAVWIRDIMALYAPHSYAEASGREFDAADPYRGYGDFRPAAPLHAKTAAGGPRTKSQVAVTDSLLAGVVGVEGGEAGGGIGVRPALRPDGADVGQLVGRATLYSLPVDKLFLSAAGEKSLGLYSALQRGIQNIKTEVAPPSAWMSAIRNLVNTGKVKKQEVFWSGIEEFLDLREKSKEKVSKEEILNVIEQGVGYQEYALGLIGLKESLPTNFQIKKVGDNASTLLGQYFDALVYEVYDSDAAAMESLEGEKLREQEKASAKILNLHDFFKENPSKVTEKEIRDAFREYAKVAGKFFLYSQEDFETPLSEWYVAFPKNQNESAAAFGRTEKQVWQRLSRVHSKMPLWGETSTKGGSDYSEILLLTGSKKTGGFRSSHFDTAGTSLIAHIRLKQYLDKNQNPILFIEEIQSDWAQEGRKKGFFDEESEIDKDKVRYQSSGNKFAEERFWAEYDHNGKTIISPYARTKQQALEDLVDELRAETVRHGPFVESTDSWVSLAVKKIILTAINNGFEGIAWTSGDQQAIRNRHFIKASGTLVYKNRNGTFNAYYDNYELWSMSGEEGKQRRGDRFEPFVADMKENESRYY
ncbi:MAG: hypothetical protein N2255_05065, partial [Kiritimatiellae bacterium]|nr:hypothetical protein [Kiritimatiellia bacterium]